MESATSGENFVADLSVTSVTGSTATLSWTQVDDGTGNPARYRVKYNEPPLEDWENATIGCDRSIVGDEIGAEISCTVEGLDSETSYDFQLMSYRVEDGLWVDAQYSNVATGQTDVGGGDEQEPAFVTDLSVTSVTGSTATLNWTQVDDGTGNPARYQLKYAEPPLEDWENATSGCDRSIVGDEIGAEISCTVEGLEPGTAYDFQLMSYRVVDGSQRDARYSNIATGETSSGDGDMVELPPLPGESEVEIRAVNASGMVVGSSGPYAVLWENGVPRDLSPLSNPRGINDAGQIVGTIDVGGKKHAALWEDGTITDLGTLSGEDESMGMAISHTGWVVGASSDVVSVSSDNVGFRWKDGELTELPPLPDYESAWPLAVNASGDATGFSYDDWDDVMDVVVWQNGVPVSTGVDRITNTPVGISDAGVVAMTSDCACEVLIWQGGVLTDLISPLGESGAGSSGSFWAATMTPGGLLMGGAGGQVYVWKDGEFTMLDMPGSISNCLAISDAGHIVCISPERTWPFLTTVAALTVSHAGVSNLGVAGTTGSTATLTWTQVEDGTGNPAWYRVKHAKPPIDWKDAAIGWL